MPHMVLTVMDVPKLLDRPVQVPVVSDIETFHVYRGFRRRSLYEQPEDAPKPQK